MWFHRRTLAWNGDAGAKVRGKSMKLNPNWDRAVGILAAFVGLGLALYVFVDVRNPLIYLALALVAGYLAHKRMNRHETPFERKERETRRMRM